MFKLEVSLQEELGRDIVKYHGLFQTPIVRNRTRIARFEYSCGIPTHPKF